MIAFIMMQVRKCQRFKSLKTWQKVKAYRVNARRQQYTADNVLIYHFPYICQFNTIEECKEFIFNYINDSVSQAIFNDQHRNALEALK